MSDCARCSQPTDTTLCQGCVTGFRVELTDVAGIIPADTTNGHGESRGEFRTPLAEELYVTMARQDRLTLGGGGRRGKWNSPMPMNLAALAALFELHTVLARWAPSVDSGVDSSYPTVKMALWLLDRLDMVRAHPDAGQLVDEVTTAIHKARHVIDRREDKRLFLGRCGAPLGSPGASQRVGQFCAEYLYGYPWLARARCHACSADYSLPERQHWMREHAHGYLGTAVEIACFLRTTGLTVTDAAIRGYAHRRSNPLQAVDTNQAGHPRYRISDVLTAVSNRYQRRTRRPSGAPAIADGENER